MIKVLAWCLGLSATIGLKMILTKTCQQKFFRSFYRTRPHQSNISTLALETWYLGLGSGVLVSRIGQFLFAAVFWIGRIDVPFLAEDVEIFGYAFDYVPTNFIKDLLIHEAHRHPYIERLAQMYLMRFHHREHFGTRAGAAWRQIFVQVLMPWIRKYRVFSRERVEQAMTALDVNRLVSEEEAKGVAERFGEDLKQNAKNVHQLGLGAAGGVVATVETAVRAVDNTTDIVVETTDRTARVAGVGIHKAASKVLP